MRKRLLTPDVRHELEGLAAASPDGKLTWQAIVAKSRDKKSALHGYMGAQGLWDKNKAQEYALMMAARMLVMRVKVNMVNNETKETIRVRAWVSLPEDREEGGGYRDIHSVMHSHDAQAALLETARNELGSFARKYRKLSELAGIISAIDDMLDPDAGRG